MATLAPPPPGLGLNADPLRPQPAGGTGPALSLALLAHAGLVAALALGTQWRASTPTAVSAELWASLPQMAAPAPATAPEPPAPVPPPVAPPPPPPPPPAPAVAPPPPAPDPQIAIEQQRRERQAREQREQQEREARERQERERQAREAREREQRQRAEAAERQRQEAAERQRQQAAERQRREREERERAAEEARLTQQREETLRRIMGQAGATGAPASTGTAARDAAPSAGYAGRLVAHIKPRIVFPGSVPGNPEAVVEVRTGPGGTVIARRLVNSSGHREWDEAVLRAIDRAGTLPRDTDGSVPALIIISFRPLD
jgi:colicin import membrane protein